MKEEVAVENLREIKDVLDKNNINYWLDLGTLLGAVRDGKIIKWDTDVDLGSWYSNATQIISAFRQLKKGQFSVVLRRKRALISIRMKLGYVVNATLYRKKGDYAWNVWIMREKRIQLPLRYVLDILSKEKYTMPRGAFVGKIERLSSLLPSRLKHLLADATWSILNKCGCVILPVIPKSYFEKLSSIHFYGMEFKTPSDVKKYLEFRYGSGWKIPTKNWIYYRDDGAISRKHSKSTRKAERVGNAK